MDVVIVPHFLLHQTEEEHLNMPVGVRQITQSSAHSIVVFFFFLAAIEGREDLLTGQTRMQINTPKVTPKGGLRYPDDGGNIHTQPSRSVWLTYADNI